jgi:hypothetical protein
MAFVVVVALVVLGLSMVVFGIVALRDEPPQWMLRFTHPGRILSLGLVVLVSALILNAFRSDFAEEVGEHLGGQEVECEKIGLLEIEGEQRQVYACVATQSGEGRIGCYAQVGDDVVDVTGRAETPGAFAGRTPDC